MDKVLCYNTTFCIKSNGQSLKDYSKIGHKDRYDLMCSVDAYEKDRVPMPDYASSSSGIPMPSTSSKKYFSHLVTPSTFLTIGYNALKSIIRAESQYITVSWVSYSKQSQNHFLQNIWLL